MAMVFNDWKWIFYFVGAFSDILFRLCWGICDFGSSCTNARNWTNAL